ncbi:DMT family transporter [Sedimentitalea todarodis]|uniref:DMT family transporter n=1 Tax=Sedimentitalea todarodis TaxID=1631240 RepID=A0ABU3VFD7_9RHOB|nr:DMT family transporter [Sedimentitalea todarodis]MDU9004884.1 DMT family transporter [Sedimentitalea todarodis]
MISILGVVWGGTFLVIELALAGITPFWLAACRIGFGALLTGAVWGLRGGRLFATPPNGGERINLCVIAALSSAMPFMLLSWGQQYVTSGFAGVSMASVALMVLPLAHFLVPGERITLRRAIGFVIGFTGITMLIGGQAFESTGVALEMPGRIACVGAAGCYAVSSVLMRRLPPVDPVGLSAMLLILGALLVIPMAWIVEGPPPMPDARTLWLVAFLGLLPTAAANLLRVTVVRTAGPVFMSLVNYQVPVWSVLMGVAILGEPLPSSLIWAMALILSGVALSQIGALRRLFGS